MNIRTIGITLSVIGVSSVLATLSIHATENMGQFSRSLVGNIFESGTEKKSCPEDMILISSPEGAFCIDRYEASPSEVCIFDNPQNIRDAEVNYLQQECVPVSEPGQSPWTFVSRDMAMELCARADKHLPSSREWFLASLGTPDTGTPYTENDCNLNRNWGIREVGATGSGEMCVSSFGAYDMTGNVWEWVDDDVVNGVLGNITLPESGYVDGVTSSGIPFTSSTSANELYGQDYFWSPREPVTAVMRGGFYGSGSDGGRYTFYSQAKSTFVGNAVGFRCARVVE
ncbi:MAG: SUMF1/EgtB/PvdO family nonheme iron enzyme [Candidatus Paceibacterota bacterium]